jgi:2,3-dihydro-2,3-dihydroxybenzoate dehydrogenase
MDRIRNPGTVVLVTGAARGPGADIARALAAAGTRVAVLDRDAASARALAAALGPRRALACPADVFDGDAVEDAVERAERDLGPIGVLVNVAGILRPGPAPAALCEDGWADTFAVSATGVFLVSRAVARRMVPRRTGAIVTVASDAAVRVPGPRLSVGAASGATAVQFTRCLGRELAEFGIRCEVVALGDIAAPGAPERLSGLARLTRLQGVA